VRKLILAVAAMLLLPAAHAQEKKGMEKMDMEKKHGAMHEKMEKKKGKHAAKKGGAAKKEEHKH
jgi:Ni/Co efflux regulator RcnB